MSTIASRTPWEPETRDIALTNVVKTFPNGFTAIHGITATIPRGQIITLTGPSGSGKSTLLHLLGGIENATSGSIVIDAQDITTLSRSQLTKYRRGLGFVFQRFHLLPALTALDNVIAPVLPYKTTFDKHARGRELLAAVGLQGREASLTTRMSGGQQQRVAIARALINRPHMLLADEPTGNLDTTTGAEVISLIRKLHDETGMTVIIATHDPSLAEHSDLAIHLVDGELDAI